jgi:hypothetical protein
MKVAMITANLGNFDPSIEPVPQVMPDGVELEMFQFTDENFPPRSNSMTPRLQARIPKMFGWEMVPGFDYYIWYDSSLTPLRSDSAAWLLSKCIGYDVALFPHPWRKTIEQEAKFISDKIKSSDGYLTPRYAGELIEEQMAVIRADKSFQDNRLYASTVLVYCDNKRTRAMLKEWWVHSSRYHSVDQLSLPYVVSQYMLSINEIHEKVYNFPYLTYTRKKKR